MSHGEWAHYEGLWRDVKVALDAVTRERQATQDDRDRQANIADAVKADRDRLQRDYAQLKEAYDAKASGVPIGPIVGAQTIVNQAHEIKRLLQVVSQLQDGLSVVAAQREALHHAHPTPDPRAADDTTKKRGRKGLTNTPPVG